MENSNSLYHSLFRGGGGSGGRGSSCSRWVARSNPHSVCFSQFTGEVSLSNKKAVFFTFAESFDCSAQQHSKQWLFVSSANQGRFNS